MVLVTVVRVCHHRKAWFHGEVKTDFKMIRIRKMMMTITTTIMIMMTDIVKELLRYLGL